MLMRMKSENLEATAFARDLLVCRSAPMTSELHMPALAVITHQLGSIVTSEFSYGVGLLAGNAGAIGRIPRFPLAR
jgi:hypothetical protein